MSKDSFIPFTVKLANGAPLAVGTDISTIQRFRFVRAPPDVARDAEEGKMICTFV